MSNVNQVRQAIQDHPDKVTDLLVDLIVSLGAKSEWDSEDNYGTTEAVAWLAGEIGLPSAGDQTQEGHLFYALAARELIYVPDDYDEVYGEPDEPWCNHDAVAVIDGVCECGERIPNQTKEN